MRKKKDEQESEQHKIAHFEDLPIEDIDLDALFRRVPDADAQLQRIREASAADLARIDEETQAFIKSENAKVYPEGEKSEQHRIAYIDDLSRKRETNR